MTIPIVGDLFESEQTSTQTTNIPAMTAEEEAARNMVIDKFLPFYMQEAKMVEYQTEENKQAIADWEGKKEEFTNKYKSIYAGIDIKWDDKGNITDVSGLGSGLGGKLTRHSMPGEFQNFAGPKPKDESIIRRQYPHEVEAQIAEFGFESEEAKAAMGEFHKGEEYFEGETQKLFYEQSIKYLQGDFAASEAQKQQIAENMAPIRATIDQMYATPEELDSNFEQMQAKAREAGVSIEEFAASAGYSLQRGKSIPEAFQEVMDVNRKMMELGIEDATGQVTRQTMERAVSMGRDPMDPEFQRQIQMDVSKISQQGQLQLAEMESKGKMDIARERGVAELSAEEQAMGMRSQAGGGVIPSQVSVGQSVGQYQQALDQQRLQNIQGAAQMPSQYANQLANLRMSQPTTTSTGVSTPSTGSMILGVGGLAASAYSGYQSGQASSAEADWYRSN